MTRPNDPVGSLSDLMNWNVENDRRPTFIDREIVKLVMKTSVLNNKTQQTEVQSRFIRRYHHGKTPRKRANEQVSMTRPSTSAAPINSAFEHLLRG